jgi:hypothetical protein
MAILSRSFAGEDSRQAYENKKSQYRVWKYWPKSIFCFFSFPNTGGRTFSSPTLSTTLHGIKTLEGIGSENLYVINNLYKYFLSVKKIKNRCGIWYL